MTRSEDRPAANADTLSWRELTEAAAARLREAGSGMPDVDARRIAEEVTGAAGSDFFRVLSEAPGHLGTARFEALVARRVAGEPLQYVIGSWGFRGLDLMVDERVLIPRPETEVVAGLAIAEIAARNAAGSAATAADLGTGSGAIAASIAAECPGCRVLATDASEDALAVARANLSGLGRAAARVSLHQGDWFDALPAEVRGDIDVVVANPPYVAAGDPLPAVIDDWEPRAALRSGAQGDEDLCRIISDAPGWLAPDGVLVLEMSPHQTQPMQCLASSAGFETTVHDDLAGKPRALLARRTQAIRR